MRLTVISDTHSEKLPPALIEDIKKSDLVVHVGDFCEIAVLERIRQLKEVRAVYGNMDGLDLRAALPRKLLFKCEGVTIGLFHGEGGPDQLMDKVKAVFGKESVDVLIFGHSHEAFNKVIDGVLYFNPGSPTDTMRAPYRSYGVLEVSAGKVNSMIVKIK
ncbi:MAG: metallophosphoesterase family protein [Candidatus Omnitrophica bacterium]|nr:metallophosphoesterase family protein [Candidatus Omnitrophota bacterium]